MWKLTIVNLTSSLISIQDPTGLTGTSFTIPGNNTVVENISALAYGNIEPALAALVLSGSLSWAAEEQLPPATGGPSPCQNHVNAGALATLLADLDFWSKDLMEHCIFQEYGMTADPTVQSAATALVADWTTFRTNMTIPAAKTLTQTTLDFNNAIYARQVAGEWLGWLYPSVTAHIIEETQFFLDALNGVTWTAQQLRTIWSEWNADHAVNISHFLDPQETPAHDQAVSFHRTFDGQQQRAANQSYGCDCALDAAIVQAGTNFNGWLDSLGVGSPTGVPSVLIPLIITHLQAEGTRANAVIALLGCSTAP